MKSFKKCHQAISEKIYQMNSVKIKEIFSSIQGEGRYIGYKQLFIRFAGCNLGCKYCDTDYSLNENYREYTVDELVNEVAKYTDIHSVSLTGGEPLMSVEFLKEFLPKVEKKIYLETNATLFNELKEIKRYVDIISADIKLKSATGLDTKELHNKFFEACSGIETFAKIVFNKSITDSEISDCVDLGKKYGTELILQPEMIDNKPTVDSEFAQYILDKFLMQYDKVRLIPQVHKFLNVR